MSNFAEDNNSSDSETWELVDIVHSKCASFIDSKKKKKPTVDNTAKKEDVENLAKKIENEMNVKNIQSLQTIQELHKRMQQQQIMSEQNLKQIQSQLQQITNMQKKQNEENMKVNQMAVTASVATQQHSQLFNFQQKQLDSLQNNQNNQNKWLPSLFNLVQSNNNNPNPNQNNQNNQNTSNHPNQNTYCAEEKSNVLLMDDIEDDSTVLNWTNDYGTDHHIQQPQHNNNINHNNNNNNQPQQKQHNIDHEENHNNININNNNINNNNNDDNHSMHTHHDNNNNHNNNNNNNNNVSNMNINGTLLKTKQTIGEGPYQPGEVRQCGWMLQNITSSILKISSHLECIGGNDKENGMKISSDKSYDFELKPNEEVYILIEVKAPLTIGKYCCFYQLALNGDSTKIGETLEILCEVTSNYSEQKEKKIATIIKMGFDDRKIVIDALIKNKWNVQNSVTQLLNQT